MGKSADLTGQRFGRLVVVERTYNHSNKDGKKCAKWKCQCDCGNVVYKTTKDLRSGNFKSCGCLKKEMVSKKRLVDLTGKRFGKLVVVRLHGRKGGIKSKKLFWNCRCDCGNYKIISGNDLRSGKIVSCGCYHSSELTKRNTTHGLSHTRIHNIWLGMKERCYNKNSFSYKDYGGRGVIICDEWLKDFMNFYNWSIANGYQDDLSIDRIDVNGNYEPSNCRWATNIQQSNNTTRNIVIKYNGKERTLAEWCRELGLNYSLIHSRINELGWSAEKAFTTDTKK